MTNPPPVDRTRPMLQMVARVVGGSAAFVWSSSLLASLAFEGVAGFSLEGAILGFLIVGAVAGVIVGFRNEERGGVVTGVAGVGMLAFALASAGRNHLLAAAVSGGPFLAAGVLFVVSARRVQQNVR